MHTIQQSFKEYKQMVGTPRGSKLLKFYSGSSREWQIKSVDEMQIESVSEKCDFCENVAP